MNLIERIIFHFRYNRFNIFKTIWINLKCFQLKKALKVPIIIRGKCQFDISDGGKIIIDGDVYTGMINIGISDPVRSYSKYTFLRINGVLEIAEGVVIRRGCNIYVKKNAHLILNKNVFISDNTSIISHLKINIGKHTVIGNNCNIIDTDFHFMTSILNKSIKHYKKPIDIGNHNWIGPFCMIKKGSKTPEGTTLLGPFSMISKDYTINIKENSVIGGCPARLIKNDMILVTNFTKEELLKNYFIDTEENFIIPADQDAIDWSRSN